MKLRQLPNANQRCMRVSVVAVPDWCIASGRVIPNTLDRHLNSSSRIGDKNHVELIRVGIEEAEGAFANRIDTVSS